MTAAILKLEGTMPDSKEELIMSTKMGHRLDMHALTKAVGMWSREQVEALALMTNLAASGASTEVRQLATEAASQGGGTQQP